MDERRVFSDIISCDSELLKQRFTVRDDKENEIIKFIERNNPQHYICVFKERPIDSFLALVNADFDFVRPAGSNNYPELLDVAKLLCKVFGYHVDWCENPRR